jgi:hypothetical protein
MLPVTPTGIISFSAITILTLVVFHSVLSTSLRLLTPATVAPTCLDGIPGTAHYETRALALHNTLHRYGICVDP